MKGTLGFVTATWGANLRSALEYRAAFVAQAFFMLVNNFMFLAFWALFFERFQAVRGWTLQDVALLYAIVATGFGLAAVLSGGTWELAGVIAGGRLDTWLLRPRPVLLQAASSKLRVAGFGDMASGVILLLLSGNLSFQRVGLFLLMACVSGLVLASFFTLCNASAFWFGNAEDVAMQGANALVTFSLYPPVLFRGTARLVLYLVLPAGLVGYTPAALVRAWSWPDAGLLAVGVAAVVGVTALAWTLGLRRYESGNLTQSVED